MELLDEYQNALKKIKELEEKLAEYKETTRVASKGLTVICKELERGAHVIDDDHDCSLQEKMYVNEFFYCPKRMIESVIKTINMPFMSKEERKKAEMEVIQNCMEDLKAKMENFVARGKMN